MLAKTALPVLLVLGISVACASEEPSPPASAGNTGVSGKGGSSAGTPAVGGAGSGGQPAGGTSGSSAGTPAGGAGGAGAGGATSGSAGVSGGGTAGALAAGMGGTTAGAAGAGMGGGGAGSAGDAGTSGGGAMTAGSAGTAGTAGSTGGGGTGGDVNAVVTDDFEAASLDAAKWQMGITGQGTIAVSTEQKHGGNQSVKVVGMSGPVMFVNTSVFPLPGGVVHFRVWMRFTSADWANHIAFVAASPGSQSQEVRFGGQNNAYHANLAADGDGLSPDPFEFPECAMCVAPVANEWACLRGKFDFPNSDAQLYVNETLAVDAQDADDWHSGTGMLPQNPTQIGFGWALYGGAMNTVYYDDIAIGYEPIPCE